MNCKHSIKQVEGGIPETLASRNLLINKVKTEKYEIKKNGDESWRKYEYLGNLLDTSEEKDWQEKQWTRSSTIKGQKARHRHQDESI